MYSYRWYRPIDGCNINRTYWQKIDWSTKETKHFTYTDGEIVEVSEERVWKAVRELKNGKSCGPEGVYAEMLKHGTDKLIKMLTWVMNRCLNGEEIVQKWEVA